MLPVKIVDFPLIGKCVTTHNIFKTCLENIRIRRSCRGITVKFQKFDRIILHECVQAGDDKRRAVARFDGEKPVFLIAEIHDPPDLFVAQIIVDEFIQDENAIESLVDFFIESIKKFKNSYTTDEKKEFVSKLNNEIDILNLKIARLEQDNLCENYKNILAKISELDNEQERLRKELVESQSDYLEKYYKRINVLLLNLVVEIFL